MHDDASGLSSAAPSRVVAQVPQLPSQPSSPPPPPPITLNPPSQSDSSRTKPLPRSVFSATAFLPRTSSLLPPPHPSTPRARSPSPVPAANASYTQHFQAHPPISLRRPSTPASITEASPREASRVRNRRSTSTVSSTSSRTSPFASHQSATSHSRRTSLDAIASHGSPPSSRQSPTKLHRGRIPSVSINRAPSPAALLSTRHYGSDHQRAISPTPPNPSARMPYDQSRDRYVPRAPSKDHTGKVSRDLGKARAQKPPSQKAMLSRALQKANTAVQLDNAQNFEGARQAYAEACDLLHQVLQRTAADEDKRKLEAIRRTYTSRIEELDQMGPWQDDNDIFKALPARPESDDYSRSIYIHHDDDIDEEAAAIETASVIGIFGDDNSISQAPYSRQSAQQQQQQNTAFIGDATLLLPLQPPEQDLLQPSFSQAPVRLRSSDGLQKQPDDAAFSPTLLTTIQSPLPLISYADEAANSAQSDFSDYAGSRVQPNGAAGHLRDGSQNSWLDPIDESGGSASSSVHSRTSSLGYRRRHIRATSGNTEAEFDTALDAAIEAAYNEGYEPVEPEEFDSIDTSEEAMMNVLRKVEIARERVRQTEREALNDMEILRKAHPQQLQQQQQQQNYEERNAPEGFYEDESSEEEERLLEEMTRDFANAKFIMEQQQNAVATRGPDDQNNEPESNLTPGVTSMSAFSEKPPVPNTMSKPLQPAAPPPTQPLPELPQAPSSPTQSVRDRRLSGHNLKQLKIETTNLGSPPKSSHGEDLSQTTSASTTEKDPEPPAEELTRSDGGQQEKFPTITEASPSEPQGVGSPMGKVKVADGDDGSAAGPSSPLATKLRKNFSSSSLRSMKSRNISLSNLDEGSDMSPGTPSSNHFGRPPALPALPTPLITAFKDNVDALPGAGLHLFDDNFHMPTTPGSPNPISMDAPVPLESCPTEFLLRPFWLMRCLYQTLVHPRGGYLSTKLFVPRDVWRVKGVKLKNVDEKIANCDYLTAALLKLAKVDTLDADAVLEEMQSLEGVLEQVQAALTRKLGNEVGVQGSGLLFKDAALAMDGDGGSSVPRSGSVSSKSSSFSWRRLRPKASTVALGGGSYTGRNGGAEAKDVASWPTLPMTSHPTTRPAKRDVRQAHFIGPNANYMASLARLFDAAQAIDQIARQVEDPGLRHADKTQVGLELCTRHAAEFFGFYICRFVLADLGLLLDKFIKRGSEWVLG